jgi:hypothetical protein
MSIRCSIGLFQSSLGRLLLDSVLWTAAGAGYELDWTSVDCSIPDLLLYGGTVPKE